MSAAEHCLEAVQEAIAVAREAQEQMNRPGSNHFDRMAINSAVEHLERAFDELACFALKEVPAHGKKSRSNKTDTFSYNSTSRPTATGK